ncbi:DctM TRAP-type C4-dicarboxylate transport system, small permease component [Burkholderiaceae bacterium]
MKARDGVQKGLLVLDSLAVLMVLVMVLLTITDVTMRKFVDKPMTGVTEMVELALGGAFFFALPGVFWRCAHITMDIIDDHLPQWRFALQRVATVFNAIVLVVLVWHMWQPMLDVISFGDTSADLQIPKIWFMAPAWLGILLSLLVVMLQMWLGTEPASAKDEHGH